MKILFALIFSVTTLTAGVEIDFNKKDSPESEKDGDANEIRFVLEITNNSNNSILLRSFNDDLSDCIFELWFTGKGVELRNPTDANWRRQQAFVHTTTITIKPGETRNFNYNLNALLSEHPENDDLAKQLISDVYRFKSGRIRVQLTYHFHCNKTNKTITDDISCVYKF